MKKLNYIVITPVRNEEANLSSTIESVATQSLLPKQWIVVNDGSTDRTPEILAAAAQKYPWMTVVNRADRGFRKNGGGVIEAFYDGYAKIKDPDWDFLVKLDGDLSFGPEYFPSCLAKFEPEPKLGIGGGMICRTEGNDLVEEFIYDPPFHVRGATKIYRRACWDGIGGLIRSAGWDTLDEVKANMLGWKTYTFKDVKLAHHRHTGDADGSWKNWFKNGRANYVVGYHPLFMLFKCIRRIFIRPYGLGALGLFSGFFTGYICRVPRTPDREVIQFLQRHQINRLLFRKSLWNE